MLRRRRPLARAAVVGGAAYYAGKSRQRGQDANAEQDARLDEVEQQQYEQQAAAPAPAPAADPDAIYEQLEKLADLKAKGVITDTEFEVQKQKLLAQT